MARRARTKNPKDDERAAVRVIRTAAERANGGAVLVPGVTDEDPNTGRRIKKKKGVAAAGALSRLKKR